jgi:hypothetical protein
VAGGSPALIGRRYRISCERVLETVAILLGTSALIVAAAAAAGPTAMGVLYGAGFEAGRT